MGRWARAALVTLLALALAGVGAAGAAALHWYVVQPSDDDLRAVAAGMTPDGFRDLDEPGVSGAWPVGFERGELHWDAVSDDQVTVDDVAAGMDAAGWTVDVDRGREAIDASRGPYVAGVNLGTADGGGTSASISVGRGETEPSLTLTVALGAALGAVVGVLLGRRLTAPRRRRASAVAHDA